jgi:hypothetical protein
LLSPLQFVNMTADSDKLPISRGQRVLRYAGAVILTACAVMFVLGLTTLRGRLHGLQIVRYWTWCFLLALVSIVCALWDAILIRRTFKHTRRQLLREQFTTPDADDKEPEKRRN